MKKQVLLDFQYVCKFCTEKYIPEDDASVFDHDVRTEGCYACKQFCCKKCIRRNIIVCASCQLPVCNDCTVIGHVWEIRYGLNEPKYSENSGKTCSACIDNPDNLFVEDINPPPVVHKKPLPKFPHAHPESKKFTKATDFLIWKYYRENRGMDLTLGLRKRLAKTIGNGVTSTDVKNRLKILENCKKRKRN